MWNLGRQRAVLSFSDGSVHGGAATTRASTAGQFVGSEQGAPRYSDGQQVFRKLVAEMYDLKQSPMSRTRIIIQRDIDTVVHGDDFVAVAEDGQLGHFEQVLENSI